MILTTATDDYYPLGLHQDREAAFRLIEIALRGPGQSRRVADFLLAWHNAEENGGWDPTDLWNVDGAIAADMLAVIRLISKCHGRYPDDHGFRDQISRVWSLWRKEVA